MARTRQGAFVQFSPRKVRRDPVTCETEAQVRILHREPQQWTSDDGKVDVLYSKETLVYRFRCATSAFLLTERRFLGADDEITHSESYAQDEQAWRPISGGDSLGADLRHALTAPQLPGWIIMLASKSCAPLWPSTLSVDSCILRAKTSALGRAPLR